MNAEIRKKAEVSFSCSFFLFVPSYKAGYRHMITVGETVDINMVFQLSIINGHVRLSK